VFALLGLLFRSIARARRKITLPAAMESSS